MTTVYVVMLEERHIDTEAFLFSDPDVAVAYAKETADAYPKGRIDPEDAHMSDDELAAAGWLYHECFSAEGGSVWVLPCEIDAEKP